MSQRTLFTVGDCTYEFTPGLQDAIINYTRTENTLDIWFEGTTLYHKYTTEDDRSQSVVTTTIDVTTVFETLPTDARDTLSQYGQQPLGGEPEHLLASPPDESLTVSLRQHR